MLNYNDSNTANKGLNDSCNALIKSFRDSQEWMYDIFRQDEIDHAAVTQVDMQDEGAQEAFLANPYAFIPFGVSDESLADTWRSTFNASVFSRVKAIALTAHIAQAYEHNHRSPISIIPTELSDAEEQEGLTEEQLKEVMVKVQRQTDRSTRKVTDMMQEGGVFTELKKSYMYFCLFGIACGEYGLYKEKKSVKFSRPVIDGITTPLRGDLTTVSKRTYCVEVTSPYDIVLDPSANGDPQAGAGCYRVRKLNLFDVQRWADDMLNLQENGEMFLFSYDAVTALIEAQKDPYRVNGTYQGISNTSEDSLAEQVHGGEDNRVFRMYTVYMQVFRKDLIEWEADELIRALDADVFYRKPRPKPTDSYEIEAVVINDVLVFAAPNPSPDKRRPIFWAGRIPVYGTNYAFSIYSITRPLTKELSRLIKNALDNTSLTSNFMVAVDETRVDSSAITFEPGAKIPVRRDIGEATGDVRQAIQQLVLTPVNSEIFQLYQLLMVALDEVSNVPKNMTGFSSGTKTAFEVGQNLSSAQTVTLDQVKTLDDKMYKPIVEHCYLSMLEDENVPDEFKSDFTVVVNGAQTFSRMILEKQKKLELLQIMASMPQEAQKKLDWENLFLSILKDLNMDDPETLVNPTETIIQQLQQQLDQLQQQAQQMEQQLEKVSTDNKRLELENNVLSRMTDLKAENLKLQIKQGLRENEDSLVKKQQDIMSKLKPSGETKAKVDPTATESVE